MNNPLVYLNGEFLPLDQARISVLDRGFLFGDGVYEVIPAYGGHLFRLKQHLDRLADSLAAIRMAPPLDHEQWLDLLKRLIADRPGDQGIYLQITRGADSKRDHEIPQGLTPTVFAMATPIKPPMPEQAERGIGCITLDDIRWAHCNVKAITLLANVLLKQQAIDEDAYEAILIRDGQAIEGAASNLFIVRNGLIITPPKGPQLLPGITRDLVLELAESAGLPYAEASIDLDELLFADEIWMTSSTKEVMAVTRLNGQPFQGGRPGPLWYQITRLYQACKERLRLGEEHC
ncbi:D-amino acid aminotransferase [Magnetovirga frankeli]|uniref:D-amino acid aminotransferase n=1 Tax=Magnetovirga frankeli TaxID=947516 RepID=UPI0012931407|nr:D-amino acid aminotransferase [gamma proteobacterium SS-5]